MCYGNVTWNLTQKAEHMLHEFENKILRRIYGPIQEKGHWRPNGIMNFLIITKIKMSRIILRFENYNGKITSYEWKKKGSI